MRPVRGGSAQIVYGSRNLRPNPRSSPAFYWGGRLLSWIANLVYGSRLTDEATGYKVIRTDVLREIGLKEEGFEFCPEVTARLVRRGVRICEVPISYRPRSRADGKKIRYLNVNDKLADKDGKLFSGMSQDRLHPTVKGYQIWADGLKPIFTEILGPPSKTDHAPPPSGDPSVSGGTVAPTNKAN